MAVLQIIQETADRLGLTRPSVVVTSTDLQVRQLFGLLKEAAEDLMEYGDDTGWQALQRQQSFVTVAAETQTNMPVPDDFSRFVNNSFYNQDTQRPVSGPLTQAQWQAQQARPAIVQPYLAFIQTGDAFLIAPSPPAGETIAYAYVSNYYAISSAGSAKRAFTSDDDTTYLDEELLKKSLRWRWKQAKGLDYGEEMVTYERALASKFGKDGGATALTIGEAYDAIDPWRLNLPLGNFGL